MHEKDAMQSLFQHFTFKLTFTFSFHHITNYRQNGYRQCLEKIIDTILLFITCFYFPPSFFTFLMKL
jgi:hypothetical protein